VLSMLQ
jgi:hypothetical protein